MKRNFKNVVAIALIGASSVAFTGCFGSFNLTTKLHDWNSNVSQKKLVNELVFLGLCILPAYEIACLGDVLIFNTIEFWESSDPLVMEPGETEESQVAYAGETFTLTKSLNKVSIANNESGVVTDFQYFPEEESWYLMEDQQKVKVVKNMKKMMKVADRAN